MGGWQFWVTVLIGLAGLAIALYAMANSNNTAYNAGASATQGAVDQLAADGASLIHGAEEGFWQGFWHPIDTLKSFFGGDNK